jgi:hypothetical protein
MPKARGTREKCEGFIGFLLIRMDPLRESGGKFMAGPEWHRSIMALPFSA